MSTTRDTYAARILRVQRFIQQHLDEDLTLERLAEVAGYSPYHFHRIFRGQVGERTDDYVRRLRMEQAAHSLRYRQRSVLDVALDSGYGSHEAFTRAFVRTYGVTPSEYQSLDRPPSAHKEQLMSAVSDTKQDVRIERLPARRIAGIRVVGPYCSATLGPAFGRIGQWATSANVWGPDTRCIGVYYDDPEVTAPEKQRADVGVTIGEHIHPTGEVQVQTLAGGTHAVLCHKGPYDKLGESYWWLYSIWLPNSGREPADAPPYEVYLNDACQTPPEELLTEICVPLAG
ncbi:MAG: AraC family transcriptional regulator [Planctomycetaceae bacterium]|nr:AraC family transcriptional regulator [Planctomycetaceae bacterium]